MWPVLVVVVDVVDDETLELGLVPDDRSVEELAAQGADPAFCEGVGDRGPDRGLEDLAAFGSEDLIEPVDELAATVAYERLAVGEEVAVGKEQIPCCLDGPGPGGVGGDPTEEHFSGRDVYEEQ